MYNKPVEVYEGRFVLESIREDDAYLYYTGITPEFGKKYLSPFSKEKTPSFVLYPSDNTDYKYYFTCYSTGRKGRLPDLLMEIYNLDYVEALKKIAHDGFANGIFTHNHNKSSTVYSNQLSRVPIREKKETIIKVVLREFNEHDYKFWKQFGIFKEDLEQYDIKACSEVWYDSWKTNDLKRWSSEGLVYRYNVNGKYKIYNPYSKKKAGKWLSNTTLNSIQGLKYLPEGGDKLVITKAYKDVIVINKYLKIPSIAFQSENTIPAEKVIQYFKERFKNIIIFYDNDEPGKLAAKEFSARYDIPFVYIDEASGVKDCSDYVKKHGIPAFIEMGSQLLK